jgi:putative ABC transport system permease protein
MNKEELKIILTLFLSSAFLRKKRAILTIAAISWGTVAILLLLAFGNGLQKRMITARNGMGENVAVVWPGETSMSYQGLKEGRRIIFWADDIPFVRERIPQFSGVSGEMCNWSTTLSYKSKTLTLLVTGVNWEFGEMRNLIPQKGGRCFNANDEKEKRRVIFIGDERAKELFGNEDGVGKEVLVNNAPYTVIGILKNKLQMGAYYAPDSYKCVIPITTFISQFGKKEINNYVLKVSSPEKMEGALKEFKKVMAVKCGFSPEDPKGIYIWDTVKSSKQLLNFTIGIKIFLGIIGVLTLLVGGTGVANIMYAVVKEKTKEIGIMMAIGAKPKWITTPFLLQSFFYTIVGGFFGLIISFVIVFIISIIPTEGNEALQFLGKPELSLPIGIFTSLILGFVGFLSGYFPSRRASLINPAETLRYE